VLQPILVKVKLSTCGALIVEEQQVNSVIKPQHLLRSAASQSTASSISTPPFASCRMITIAPPDAPQRGEAVAAKG
jgi:hypothetical protein